MHHRLHAGSDRLETGQPQQVHGCGAQCAHRAGAIASVAVGVFMELGVPDPVPALNAPTVAHKSQQGFWRQGSLEVRQNSVPEAVLASPAVTEVP